MKKILLVLCAVLLGLLTTHDSFAQLNRKQLVIQTQNPSEQNFFEIRDVANAYYQSINVENGYYLKNGEKTKVAGWKQFKRWEYYWENRVDIKTGAFPSFDKAVFYKEREANATRSATGNWQSLGPSTSPGGYAGLGRINVVGFRTGDNNTLYAGSPSGGLWKTTDGGSNWSVLTDENAVLGVSDIVVIAGGTTSTDVVYIATGDRDGGSMWSMGGGQGNDNNSIGVLKSTDGGSTWTTTGLTFTTSQGETVNRLLLDPNSSNLAFYAATSAGVYKTSDAGVTWSNQLTATEFISMEFKPGDPTIIYGATRGGTIYRSTDSGGTWTSITTTGGSRVQLAVSANDPTIVYAVANSSGGLDGIYKSTDSGASYTKVFDGSVSGNNMLGSNCAGTSTGGQGTYDLCIAADPTDADIVFVGGVNTWKSADGGSSWAINTIWSLGNYPTCAAVETHADKHFLGFQNGTTTLFEGNDGGVYKTSDYGVNWSFISSGMHISQMYRLGVSQTSSTSIIAGLQDNGTKSKSGSTWSDVIGGDGMECAIDHTAASTQYGEYQGGNIFRTTNSWTNSTLISGGLSGNRAWVTPYLIDPSVNTTLYAGCQDVWKSTDQGTNWTQISTWSGNTLRSLTVAPSNSNYIYAATQTILYATTDGGSNWTNITGTLPVGSSLITYISVKADDPQTAWVSFGAYNSHGVYETIDGGTSWTNVSSGLPSIPVMCVVQNKQNIASNELYAATDVGVYVRVGSGGWSAFNTGLPNVVVSELEIYYNTSTSSLSRLRAATFGRGVWESELYSPPASPPVADFSADILDPGVGQTVTFSDLSTNLPTSWSWSFSPSTVTYVGGTSSSSQMPQVQFDATGNYDVQLTATNAYGSDAENKSNYITVSTLASYCAASGSTLDEYISGVVMGTINNTGTGSSGYTDYTAMSTNVTVNQSESIIVTITIPSAPGSYYSGDDIGIWIDWNRDGDFNDTGENVVCNVGMTSTQGTFSISTPSDALLGYTTMRIRQKWNDEDCGSPCGTTQYGEVEDYKINVLPATNTWAGTSSTDWSTAGNWSQSLVPNSAMDIIIPSSPSGGVFPVISSTTLDATVNNLTIQTGANISIAGFLTVNGTLTNNAGNSGIVVESTASTNGSLITDTDGISATVKRYLSGGKWHLIGAPVSGATANFLYFNNSPSVWLRSYNENDNTWTNHTDLSTSMPFGMGFGTWVETGNNATVSFTGSTKAIDLTLNNGSTPPLAFTDASHGYNLVANPYPSALDWDQGGWTLTNIDGSIYVYNDGTYLTRNSNGQGSLTDGIIPVGQGFFVKTTSGTPSFTIPKQARVHSSQAYYGPTGNNEEGPPHAIFDIFYGDETDQAWITFVETCGDDYDNGWDVNKRMGDDSAPQLFFNHNDYDLSIAAVGPLDESGFVASLQYEAREFGDHELMLSGINKLDEFDIFLEDKDLGKIQDLKLEPSYLFYSNSNIFPDRFLVHFNPIVTGLSEGNIDESIRIYSWDKSIYIVPLNDNSLKDVQVQVYDLYGRQLVKRNVHQSGMIRIPVAVNNTYLVVNLVQSGNIVVKKVFVQ